jgi:hypothetical protein
VECRGTNQDSSTAIAVSFVTMRKRKAQREHHYIRVVITYTDGETSGNRVFKDKIKAEQWTARQKRSATVKGATLKPFMRDVYNAPTVWNGCARPSSSD